MGLRILHIAPFFHGGVGIVAYNLTKEFINLGNEVIVASPAKPPEKLADLGLTYHSLRGPSLKDPFYSIQFFVLNREAIKRIVEREKPDVVLTHGPLIAIASTIHNIPVVSVVHGTYFNEVKWMWYHPIFGFDRIRYTMSIYTTYRFDMALYKYITRLKNVYLVAVSKNTRKELITSGALPGKTFAILNGVDKDLFKPMSKDYAKTLIEEIFKIKLKGKVLLHVNPGPIKGTHILIKAVGILKKIYGEDFTLLIVGKLGPRTYREHVEKMIKSLGLEYHVKIVGYVKDKVLPIFYNAADVTVAPSYSEGAPLVIPESLACGTPVIATDVGGNSEYLKLAHLDDLIVEVRWYDFSIELAQFILKALNRDVKMLNSVRCRLPEWSDVAKAYTKLFKFVI